MTRNRILATAIVVFAAIILFFALRPYFFPKQPIPESKLSALQKLWEFQTGGGITGALALGDDTLYAASHDGFLYALDLSGSLRWKARVGSTSSSPAVGPDGAIYITGRTGRNGRIVALNRSGEVRWSTEVPGDADLQNASAIGPDYLYAPCYNSLCALRLSDGQVDWAATFWGGDQWSAVTLLPDGTILSTGRSRLNALNSRGDVLWQVPPFTQEEIGRNSYYPPPGSFSTVSGVSISADRTLLASVANSRVAALGFDGSAKWELKMWSWTTPLIASDGTIYVEDVNGTLFALDPYGNKRWSLPNLDTIRATPVLAEDGTIFVLSSSWVSAISPQGELLARGTTGGGSESSPTLAPDGTVFAANSTGTIFAFAGGHGGLMNSPWPKFQADLANSGASHVQ